jgi:hypothetical protein
VRDIRADLRERLGAVENERSGLRDQLRALDIRERQLGALLEQEEAARELHRSGRAVAQATTEAPNGAIFKEFVLASLKRGDEWSLDDLKEHGCGLGLTDGRSLNITLVNLLRQGRVTRSPNGKWRLADGDCQLVLEFDDTEDYRRLASQPP